MGRAAEDGGETARRELDVHLHVFRVIGPVSGCGLSVNAAVQGRSLRWLRRRENHLRRVWGTSFIDKSNPASHSRRVRRHPVLLIFWRLLYGLHRQ